MASTLRYALAVFVALGLSGTQLARCAESGTAATKAKPSPTDISKERGWKDLFDGKTLGDWKRTDFFKGGDVKVDPKFRGGAGAIVVSAGELLNGINWTKDMPKTNYEVYVESMKIDGKDFMLGLTFPVADSYASLILGGWGGMVVGISSIDHLDASENETTKGITFENDRWYKVRLKVTPAKLEAWLDDKQIVDVKLKDKTISLRFGDIKKSIPLGLATYQTSAAYRAIKLRKLDAK